MRNLLSRMFLLCVVATAGCGARESCNLSPRAADASEVDIVRQQHEQREALRQQQEAAYFSREVR